LMSQSDSFFFCFKGLLLRDANKQSLFHPSVTLPALPPADAFTAIPPPP
jgi:hypothetical protein